VYKVELVKSAEKALLSLPNDSMLRIYEAIQKLSHNPFPLGYKKLQGHKNRYRIRIGYYRVLYIVENGELTIVVIKIGHRKDVYK